MHKTQLSLLLRSKRLSIRLGLIVMATALCCGGSASQAAKDTVPAKAKPTSKRQPLYSFTLTHDGKPASYDEAMAVACLQGIINRKSPELYVWCIEINSSRH